MTTWVQDNGGGIITISNLSDIDDGGGYYKSPELWVTGDKAKLDGIEASATIDQTGNEIKVAINASNADTLINADKLEAGTTNQVLTVNEKAGAGAGYIALTSLGKVVATAAIDTKAQNMGTVHDLAVGAFSKTGDILDDVVNGSTYKKVSTDSVDASGRVDAVHDGSGFRGIGVASGDIALLASGGRFPAGYAYGKTISLNGSGEMQPVDGTTTDLDDLNDGAAYVRTPIGEEKETILWSESLSKKVAGAVATTVAPFIETSDSPTAKLIIPYTKKAGDQSIDLDGLSKTTNAGGEAVITALDVESETTVSGVPSGSSVVTAGTEGIMGTDYSKTIISIDVSALVTGTHYFIIVKLSVELPGSTASLANVIITKSTKVVA